MASLLGGLADALGIVLAKSKVAKAREALETTPRTIQEPVYDEYRYDLARLDAAKVMTVNYYVLDRRNRTYFKSTFDVTETHSFRVAYKVHDDDTRRESIFSAANTEEEVDNWEKAPVPVELSRLVAQTGRAPGRERVGQYG